MNEFEQKLSSILSDPQEMERLKNLAAQIMGGASDSSGDTPAGMPELSGLLGQAGQGGDKAALIKALAPFLSPGRLDKLQKALRLAQAARMAGLVSRFGTGVSGQNV